MFGCPLYIHNTKKACFVRPRGVHMPQYIWMLPYVWMPPVCLMPHMFGCPSCLDSSCIFECPPYASLYVWIPPYIWVPPMFGCPLVCLDAPICLDDVWIPPVHTQHKESMLCQARGIHMHPYIWMSPVYNNTNKACFVRLRVSICPQYIWMPPVCLDDDIYLDAPPVCLNAPMCLDTPYIRIPLYV